uniref:Kinesin motor domain-containing protein n=1 Tax=Eutreptiella gymnastica TaxID=73025 RepID=A0A6U8CU79_9EUGL|mmetsp:Transcript_26825/g.48201  ORF Transcript_26825/g.48201 Transcript_26825/m.48201 type:complete len:1096 (+) Transcript_26825:76-3363(+)
MTTVSTPNAPINSRSLYSTPNTPGPDIVPDSETIKVYLRIRPLTIQEERENELCAIRKCNERCIEINQNMTTAANTGKYFFDQVFDEDAPQANVYEVSTRGLANGVFDGKNSLVFAYGVTNAGKTYTVHGVEEDEGILPRTLKTLFGCLQLLQRHAAGEDLGTEDVEQHFGTQETFAAASQSFDAEAKYVVMLSCLEIYNEKLGDLLDVRKRELRMIEENGEMRVKGLTQLEVKTPEDAIVQVKEAKSRCQFGQTHLNADSSRSHSAFFLNLCKYKEGQYGIGEVVGKVIICDLAGSERTARTQTTGPRLKEAANINQSLVVLGRCLESLRWNQTHPPGARRVVPYRESKITRLFQSTLSGNGKAVMVVNVSPCARDVDETVHALKYSAIAKEVTSLATPGGSRHMGRKMQVGGSEIPINTMQQALTEIQSLSSQLVEAKGLGVAKEFEVRAQLSKSWAESLKQMQIHMFDGQQELEERQEQSHKRVMQLQEAFYRKKIEDLKEEIAARDKILNMKGSFGMANTSVLEDPDEVEKTEVWTENRVGNLEKRVSRLMAELATETTKNKTAQDELDSLKQSYELKDSEAKRQHAKEKASLEDKMAALNDANVMLELKLTSTQSENHKIEGQAEELRRRVQELEEQIQDHVANTGGKIKQLEEEQKSSKIWSEKVKRLEQALSQEQQIQKNHAKTIDNLSLTNAQYSRTIQGHVESMELQKKELDRLEKLGTMLRDEKTKVQAKVRQVEEALEQEQAECRALKKQVEHLENKQKECQSLCEPQVAALESELANVRQHRDFILTENRRLHAEIQTLQEKQGQMDDERLKQLERMLSIAQEDDNKPNEALNALSELQTKVKDYGLPSACTDHNKGPAPSDRSSAASTNLLDGRPSPLLFEDAETAGSARESADLGSPSPAGASSHRSAQGGRDTSISSTEAVTYISKSRAPPPEPAEKRQLPARKAKGARKRRSAEPPAPARTPRTPLAAIDNTLVLSDTDNERSSLTQQPKKAISAASQKGRVSESTDEGTGGGSRSTDSTGSRKRGSSSVTFDPETSGANENKKDEKKRRKLLEPRDAESKNAFTPISKRTRRNRKPMR